MTELCKLIFLECWYNHDLYWLCPKRTKPSRRTWAKREGLLPRGM